MSRDGLRENVWRSLTGERFSDSIDVGHVSFEMKRTMMSWKHVNEIFLMEVSSIWFKWLYNLRDK